MQCLASHAWANNLLYATCFCHHHCNHQLSVLSRISRTIGRHVQHPADVLLLSPQVLLEQSDNPLPRDHAVRQCSQIKREQTDGGVAAQTVATRNRTLHLRHQHHQTASYFVADPICEQSRHPSGRRPLSRCVFPAPSCYDHTFNFTMKSISSLSPRLGHLPLQSVPESIRCRIPLRIAFSNLGKVPSCRWA